MSIRTLIVMIVSAALFGAGCGGSSPESASSPQPVSTQSSEGVVLHGCGTGAKVIENTNPFPVRIRVVYQGEGADKTQGVIFLNPSSEHQLKRRYVYDAYLIYTTQGVLIGFLDSRCEE